MGEEQASILLRQLGGVGKLTAMIGAKNFLRTAEADGTPALSFRFSGSKNANYARIALEGSDTYTLTLGRVRGAHFTETGSYGDLDPGQLRRAFEVATGLYLSLGTLGRANPKKKGKKNPGMRPGTRVEVRSHRDSSGKPVYRPGILGDVKDSHKVDGRYVLAYFVTYDDGGWGVVQPRDIKVGKKGKKNPGQGVRLPSRVGESTRVSVSGKTLVVKKGKPGSYSAKIEGQVSQVGGPSGTRWGNAKEMKEDIQYFLRTGALPFSGGTVR